MKNLVINKEVLSIIGNKNGYLDDIETFEIFSSLDIENYRQMSEEAIAKIILDKIKELRTSTDSSNKIVPNKKLIFVWDSKNVNL